MRFTDEGAHHDGVRIATAIDPGLCRTCVHARLVPGARSTFVRCALAETDEHFPRYPRLPVLQCNGFTNMDPEHPGALPES